MAAGSPFDKKLPSGTGQYCYLEFENLFISKCFNCERLAVWAHDTLLIRKANSVLRRAPIFPPTS